MKTDAKWIALARARATANTAWMAQLVRLQQQTPPSTRPGRAARVRALAHLGAALHTARLFVAARPLTAATLEPLGLRLAFCGGRSPLLPDETVACGDARKHAQHDFLVRE